MRLLDKPETDASRAEFYEVVERQIAEFPNARLFHLAESGSAKMSHYHAILRTIFHQTSATPYTMATAAAHCSAEHLEAKEYLLHHADEEKMHWRWVLDDLRSTGYEGVDPREELPHPTCLAYVAFNDYVARTVPIARLAISTVLEGIAARHGGTLGRRLLDAFGLRPHQATFFLSHGVTDQRHSVELREVIAASKLSDTEWRWM